jgi:hypothetical protein
MTTDWSSATLSREEKTRRRRLWIGIAIGVVVTCLAQLLVWFAFNHLHSRPGFMERAAYRDGRTIGLDQSWIEISCLKLAEFRYERTYKGTGPLQTTTAFYLGCDDARNNFGDLEDDPMHQQSN